MEEVVEQHQHQKSAEFRLLLSAWAIMAIILFAIGYQNRTSPGPYYDEAVFSSLAKDFVTGQVHGPHTPGCRTITIFGRPFPSYVQVHVGAFKDWLQLPALAAFGHTLGVVRLSSLAWGLVALLLFMVWVWQWLGLRAALVAGPLLGFDPAFFFTNLFDFGSAVPSYLCRFATFLFVIRWWKTKSLPIALLAGFFAGAGFSNKMDFSVVVGGVGLAALVSYWRPLVQHIRERPLAPILGGAGFLLGALSMLVHVFRMVHQVETHPVTDYSRQTSAKLNVLVSMLDGSHFYRMFEAGGLFEQINYSIHPFWIPTGMIFLIAVSVLGWGLVRKGRRDQSLLTSSPTKERNGRESLFVLLALSGTCLGFFLLPGAERIYHATLIYPFPQLALVILVLRFWPAKSEAPIAIRAALTVCFIVVLAGAVFSISKTERFLHATGGRGWWSGSLSSFIKEVQKRDDLALISLDWGFNEQLLLFTDGPKTAEPFWLWWKGRPLPPQLPRATNYIYLIHPPEYTMYHAPLKYFQDAMASGSGCDVTQYSDKDGRIAFFTLQFRPGSGSH